MPKPLLSAVIPCLNEEKTLPICIKKAQACFAKMKIAAEIVVGDNGSTDKSVQLARKLGARVVQQNIKGYGAALKKAIEAARGQYIVMADADDSYDWSNLEPFIRALDEGYDFVIGNRFRGKIFPGAMPFLHRYIGNPVLSAISKFLYKVEVGDFHCGMRAFTRQAFHKMDLQTDGMEFATEMIVSASYNNLSIAEIPINLYPDKRSGPSHLRSFRDGWRHLRLIMTYAPNYLYLAPGTLMFFLGMMLMIALINGPITVAGFYMGIHFLALGLLLTIVGMSIISQGLIAKVYLAGQSPGYKTGHKNRVVNWLNRHYTLERGILLGGSFFLAGFITDAYLLYRWLAIEGPMKSSIHLAFVGTGLVAIGITIIFSSFLVGLFLSDRHKQNRSSSGSQ